MIFKNEPELIFYTFFTIKWFYVLLSHTNIFIYMLLIIFQVLYVILIIQFNSFICGQVKSFKCRKWLDISIWPIDRILTGTTSHGLSGPGSNDNEGVIHVPIRYMSGASPSDDLFSYLRHSVGEGSPRLCKGAVGVFYSPNRVGQLVRRVLPLNRSAVRVFYSRCRLGSGREELE